MPIVTHLIADQFGSHIGKYSGRLKITQGGQTLAQAPIMHLQDVTIANSGVSISAEAIRACTEQGVPIHFLSGTGKPYASLYSAGLTGTILTRRAQLSAYTDARALHLVANLIEAKLQNQASLLRYAAKYRKEVDPTLHQELRWLSDEIRGHLSELDTWLQLALRDDAPIEQVRNELFSIEGRAAHKYWAGMAHLLPTDLQWPGREGRGAADPFNSALNYSYGILYTQIERALTLAGLDPYGGFLHADRAGKPSLVLDLIEPFRAPIADRTLLGMVNRGIKLEQDKQGFLTEKTRRTIAEKILGRLDTPEQWQGERHQLRHIIQHTARNCATYLRGERHEFIPFIAKW